MTHHLINAIQGAMRAALAVVVLQAPGFAAQAAQTAPTAEAAAAAGRAQVEAMKRGERGPFVAVRWYCKDGTTFPPTEYACADHGGGVQHGEWSAQTKALRDKGYRIGNVLAGGDVEKAALEAAVVDAVGQLLIEKFLIESDDGWIFRRARYYRGAVQEEDERKASRELLVALAARPEWIGLRWPMLRIAARLLPHGRDEASMQKVRQMAAAHGRSRQRLPATALAHPQRARGRRRCARPRLCEPRR